MGERLRVVRAAGALAVVGDVDAAPAIEAEALRAYDAVVRRVGSATRAVLPARFGTVVADEEDLARLLAPRAGDLAEAIALVTGREQMTLRVFRVRATTAQSSRVRGVKRGGPGTTYLATRLAAERRARSVPEISWLRPALQRLVVAERVERHQADPLVASVHHLVARGRGPAYLAAIERASHSRRAVRVVASGPWPPYAFTPETVGA